MGAFLEVEILGVEGGFSAGEDGHGSGEAESGLAGGAGIEIKDAIDGFAKGFVGMAEDDDVGLFAGDAFLERIG